MKKTALLISILMVVALFLTGCGGNKQAGTGLPQDVVTKIASAAENNKASNPTSTSEKSLDNQNQAADSQKVENKAQTEAPKNVDNAKPVESKPAESTPAASKSTGSTNQDKGTTSGAAVSPPVPVPPKAAAPNTVTMSINCQTAVDKGMAKQDKFKDTVPANGIILAPTTVELKDGENAFDILKTIVRDKKIHMEYEGSKGTPYIRGINNLYEFDGGPLSGWMFCVNKVYPNYGCGEYKLKAGDVIEWNYTCNLGKDLGQEWVE